MALPHPFPYQGSKRKLASKIIQFVPVGTRRIVEPFAGSGAVSIAALYYHRAHSALLNDINRPLMQLWQHILEQPEQLADAYRTIWLGQFGRERLWFNLIRDQFNQTHQPEYLLFLLLRCVKASIRYNSEGYFNQSPDHRRNGTHPFKLRNQLLQTAALMAGKTQICAEDYRMIWRSLSPADVVYIDPPYQGVVRSKDPRYSSGVAYEDLVEALDDLNRREIPYIVSYDGRTGGKRYGHVLPNELNLVRLELDAGRSSQATLLGRSEKTYESLYLSPALAQKYSDSSMCHDQS